MKDIVDEKKLNTDAVDDVSLVGLSQDTVDSPFIPNYDYKLNGVGFDIPGSPNQSPPFGMDEFYDYAQTSFDGEGASNTPTLRQLSSLSFKAGTAHPNLAMNMTNGSTFSPELRHTEQAGTSPAIQRFALGNIGFTNDTTNNRIIVSLYKDGDSQNHAIVGYAVIPYAGLASATWEVKFTYSLALSRVVNNFANTSSTYFSIPSTANNTYASIPSVSGIAADGDYISSRRSFGWTAKVPGNINNVTAELDGDCSFTIRATVGSDEYHITYSELDVDLTAIRGIL